MAFSTTAGCDSSDGSLIAIGGPRCSTRGCRAPVWSEYTNGELINCAVLTLSAIRTSAAEVIDDIIDDCKLKIKIKKKKSKKLDFNCWKLIAIASYAADLYVNCVNQCENTEMVCNRKTKAGKIL